MSPKIIGQKGDPAKSHGSFLTGFYSMDCAFNPRGEEIGIPLGTLYEIYGEPGTAKSTLAYSLASLLAAHLDTGWIIADFEDALTPEYVSAIGENLGMGSEQAIVIAEGIYHEDKLKSIFTSLNEEVVGIGVVDSLGLLASRAEIDGELGEANMGARAKLIYQFVRKFFAFKNPDYGFIPPYSTIFAINHQQEDFGGYGMNRPGGRGKDYGAGVRVHLKREKTELKDGSLHITGTVKKLRYEGGGEGNTFQFVNKVGVGLHRGLSLIMDLRGLKVISLYKGMISYRKEKLGLMSGFLMKEWDNPAKFTPFYEILDEHRKGNTDSLSDDEDEE